MRKKRNPTTKTIICPVCGTKIQNGFARSLPAQPTARRPLLQVGERTEHAVFIPFQQSVGSGIITGLIGGVAASFAPGLEWVKIGAITGLVTTGLVWTWAIKEDKDRVWYKLERTLGLDLDGDGIIGEPQPIPKAPDVWSKHSTSSNPNARECFVIPFADYEEGRRVARAVLARNVPFTRRALVDFGALPDDPEHYSAIYQAMTKAKLIAKKSLTDRGRQYLADCLTPLSSAQ